MNNKATTLLVSVALGMILGCGNNEDNNVQNNTNNASDMSVHDHGQHDHGQHDHGQHDMAVDMPESSDMPNMDDMAVEMADVGETVDAYLKVLTDAYCARSFQCPEKAGPFIFLFGRFENEAQCKLNAGNIFGSSLNREELENAVKAGRLIVDSNKAKTCLTTLTQQLNNSTCAPTLGLSPLPDVCEDVFLGKVEEGNVCVHDEECLKGYACKPGTGTCQGVCTKRSVVGEACGEGQSCEENLSCLQSTSKCVALASVVDGQACDDDEQCSNTSRCDELICKPQVDDVILGAGESCAPGKTPICKPGSVCTDIDFTTGQGLCAAPKVMNQDCLFFFECAAQLTCVGADLQTRTAGKCLSLRVEGQACSSQLDCASMLDCVDDKCAAEPVCMFPTR